MLAKRTQMPSSEAININKLTRKDLKYLGPFQSIPSQNGRITTQTIASYHNRIEMRSLIEIILIYLEKCSRLIKMQLKNHIQKSKLK